MKKLAAFVVVIAGLAGTPGLAADMAVKAPPPAPVAPVTNWTGFYVGAQVGGASLDPSCSTTNPVGIEDNYGPCGPSFQTVDSPVTSTNFKASSAFVGGAKIGYDWQFWSHAVVGVVGDFDWTHLNANQQEVMTFPGFPGYVFPGSASEQIDWLASVRGRLGWAFDNVLFYATGGVAWTQIKFSARETFYAPVGVNDAPFDWAGQGSSDKTGAVAGGGFEYRVSQNFSVVGELLWYGFGYTSISVFNPLPGFGTTFTTQFHDNDILVGTFGANWRF